MSEYVGGPYDGEQAPDTDALVIEVALRWNDSELIDPNRSGEYVRGDDGNYHWRGERDRQ